MPAATSTQVGAGTKLGYKLTSGGSTYSPVATIVSISPDFSVGEVENVLLATTFKGYLPTLPEAELDIVIQYYFGDAAVIALNAMIFAPANVFWQIIFPDTSTITFQGFLKGLSPTFENESIIEADCSIRINTVPVFAPAT